MDMTTEAAIKRIEHLEAKMEPLMEKSRNILACSAVGQAPPVYGSTLDKVARLRRKAAEVWNQTLRHQLTRDGKTLWQSAIATGLHVRRFGDEEQLDITASDIRQLLV